VSTIYDRAVRALRPVFEENGADGHPLAYCCAPGCRHRTCAAVHAIDDADLLAYAELAVQRPPTGSDHAATALDQLRLADDLAETREQLHANALTAAVVHAHLALTAAAQRPGMFRD
jgi:hypothetical protein